MINWKEFVSGRGLIETNPSTFLVAMRTDPVQTCSTTATSPGCQQHRVSQKTLIRVPWGELSYLAPLGSEKMPARYFKQCFFRGAGGRGGITPQTVKHHASQSQDRNNKYFILYIEFVAADLLFRLARMRHAWKGDCYLNVLVFSWQILFLLF